MPADPGRARERIVLHGALRFRVDDETLRQHLAGTGHAGAGGSHHARPEGGSATRASSCGAWRHRCAVTEPEIQVGERTQGRISTHVPAQADVQGFRADPGYGHALGGRHAHHGGGPASMRGRVRPAVRRWARRGLLLGCPHDGTDGRGVVTCESFARTRVTATRSPRETSAAKIKNTTQVERIDIDRTEAAYGHGGWQAVRPLEPIGAQLNVDYAVAVALLDGPAPRPSMSCRSEFPRPGTSR